MCFGSSVQLMVVLDSDWIPLWWIRDCLLTGYPFNPKNLCKNRPFKRRRCEGTSTLVGAPSYDCGNWCEVEVVNCSHRCMAATRWKGGDETKRCNKSCVFVFIHIKMCIYIYKTGKLLKVCACDMEDSPCFNVLLYVWVCVWRDQIIEGNWSMNMKGNPETLIFQSSSPLGEVCGPLMGDGWILLRARGKKLRDRSPRAMLIKLHTWWDSLCINERIILLLTLCQDQTDVPPCANK